MGQAKASGFFRTLTQEQALARALIRHPLRRHPATDRASACSLGRLLIEMKCLAPRLRSIFLKLAAVKRLNIVKRSLLCRIRMNIRSLDKPVLTKPVSVCAAKAIACRATVF
jgi:hypothetical protein